MGKRLFSVEDWKLLGKQGKVKVSDKNAWKLRGCDLNDRVFRVRNVWEWEVVGTSGKFTFSSVF